MARERPDGARGRAVITADAVQTLEGIDLRGGPCGALGPDTPSVPPGVTKVIITGEGGQAGAA